MPARKKSTAKRSTAKRRTVTRQAASKKRRYTDAQIEDALDALATGNAHNAQRALQLPNDEDAEA